VKAGGEEAVSPLFNFDGYPQEVRDSFLTEADATAVDRIVAHLRESEETPKAIQLEHTNTGSWVHLAYLGTSIGVNWANPQKYPKDYPEYERTYYGPIGPKDVQTRRANLLSVKLGIPLETTNKRY